VEVAIQILDALAHAHARGIVHRDVKPSNALLVEGEQIDVRLLDFGLAQMAEFDTLTAMGDVPGTLAYVSPERLLGQAATPAADVWAVGVMLWESLAGRHPFQHGGQAQTTRSIQGGAEPLETVRPDLPPGLCKLVGSALALNPARRPSARRLAEQLRSLEKRRSRKRTLTAPARPRLDVLQALPGRALPAGLAAAATGWITATLPFYPPAWSSMLAAAAAALCLVAPRAGLAFTLATAFFPLANTSLGLAVAYAAVAAAWLALAWNDARWGLVAVVGPLLAPISALGLVPLVAQVCRGRIRPAVQAAAAILLAGLVAGVQHLRLPFDGAAPPQGLGITGSERPGAVAHAFWQALLAHPVLLAEAIVAAAAAAALPYVRGRGPWPAVLFGGAFLAATAFFAPRAALLPLVGAAWVTAAAIALEPRNERS
jgi:hypothetical protein